MRKSSRHPLGYCGPLRQNKEPGICRDRALGDRSVPTANVPMLGHLVCLGSGWEPERGAGLGSRNVQVHPTVSCRCNISKNSRASRCESCMFPPHEKFRHSSLAIVYFGLLPRKDDRCPWPAVASTQVIIRRRKERVLISPSGGTFGVLKPAISGSIPLITDP